MVNKIILIGNLGQDPETRDISEDMKVCKFTLATSEKYKGENKTVWHNIVLWNKTAEIAATYLKKGDKVYIEGKVDNRSYEDKEGNKRYISEVIGHNLTMLGGKPAEGQAQQQQGTTIIDDLDDDGLPF